MARTVILLIFLSGINLKKVNAEIVTSVKYNGITYYVDVIKKSSGGVTQAEVWFRVSNNASSNDDLKITELKANTQKLSDYTDLLCRGKSIVDAGKTILGCTSLVGSVFCAAGAVASDGALAFVCETTWNYTVTYGAADCLEGAADAIATYLGKQQEWKILGTAAQLANPQILEAISNAIDFMCEDVKNKKD